MKLPDQTALNTALTLQTYLSCIIRTQLACLLVISTFFQSLTQTRCQRLFACIQVPIYPCSSYNSVFVSVVAHRVGYGWWYSFTSMIIFTIKFLLFLGNFHHGIFSVEE